MNAAHLKYSDAINNVQCDDDIAREEKKLATIPNASNVASVAKFTDNFILSNIKAIRRCTAPYLT